MPTVIDGLVFTINHNLSTSTTLSINAYVNRDRNRRERIVLPTQQCLLSYRLSQDYALEQEIADLLSFQNTVRGAGYGFLFKDPLDYSATATTTTFMTGLSTQGVLMGVINGVNDKFQLGKLYKAGTALHYRAITRPYGSISIYSNGTLIDPADYTINTNTGKVTFDNPIAIGTTLTANFNFYVPVRFASDRLNYVLLGRDEETNSKIYSIQDTEIIEVREEVFYREVDNLLTPPTFPIENYIDSQILPAYETRIEAVASGFESRSPRHSTPLATFNAGDRYLTSIEMQSLVIFYRVAHGRAISFTYEEKTPYANANKTVRFDSDLNYQQEGSQMYFTPGLQLKETTPAPNRTVLPDFATNQGEIAKTTARCIKITTINGKEYFFAEHDSDIVIDGDTYKANRAFDPTASSRTVNLKVDNISLRSVVGFDEDSITPVQLSGGMFDGAEVIVTAVNWTAPPVSIDQGMVLLKGTVGKITQTDASYVIEVRTLGSSLFNTNRSFRISETCQWEFGSPQCGLDIADYTHNVEIIAVTNNASFQISGSLPARTLDNGKITMTSGKLEGCIAWVSYFGGSEILLLNPFPVAPEIGDTATVVQNCSKNFTDGIRGCRGYNNQVNFGGLPRLGPNWFRGNDFLYNPQKTLEED